MTEWLKDAVFYEIYPQSFYDTNGDGIGDLKGITEKLDYVQELGCNALWINPCFDSPFLDAGYDVSDYKKVAPRYGTNEDLYTLFRAAHEKGIRVLLDLVPGHTSYQHEWFQKSAQAQKNEYSNRFIWTDRTWNAPKDLKFVSGMTERDGNFIVNFFSSQPALNYGFNRITESWQMPYTHPDCIATREAMKDVMRFWLDHGCDGFRVDMAASLVKHDENKTATSEIWRDVRAMLDADYPEAVLVSEWSNPPKSLNCGFHCDFYLNKKGNGYNSLFRKGKDECGIDRSFFSHEGKGDITTFTNEYVPMYEKTKQKGYISFVTCNHDTLRLTCTMDERELKLAYAFLFTMPGAPFLYYGDEIGMRYLEGLVSKEGGYHRTGSRTPMQWNSGANMGFSTASAQQLYLPVDADGAERTVEAQRARADSLLNTVKAVLKIRHENSDLQSDGDFSVVFALPERYPFVYRRGGFLIAVNPSARTEEAPIVTKGTGEYQIGEVEIRKEKLIMGPQSFLLLREAND